MLRAGSVVVFATVEPPFAGGVEASLDKAIETGRLEKATPCGRRSLVLDTCLRCKLMEHVWVLCVLIWNWLLHRTPPGVGCLLRLLRGRFPQKDEQRNPACLPVGQTPHCIYGTCVGGDRLGMFDKRGAAGGNWFDMGVDSKATMPGPERVQRTARLSPLSSIGQKTSGWPQHVGLPAHLLFSTHHGRRACPMLRAWSARPVRARYRVFGHEPRRIRQRQTGRVSTTRRNSCATPSPLNASRRFDIE